MKPLPTLAEIAKHFPQFELLECLGRGGTGVVCKARQPELSRIVALRILAPEKVAEPWFAERFQREAQALARLNHPNIVTVLDFGEAGGLYYLLMEFVDGFSLRQLLQARKIPPDVALAILPKICEALQFAHGQGVVHGDIKPENVLLDYRGRVMIADFGIAKIVGAPAPGILSPGPALTLSPSAEENAGLRSEGLTEDQVLGTPHHMVPEQLADPQTMDHHADIYSAGVMFYEMLTGELPLRGKECSANVVHFPEVGREQPVVRAWSHRE
jgi:serine/threonine protein kinase